MTRPILTRAERAREAAPPAFARGVSEYQMLVALADAARRADAALRAREAALIADVARCAQPEPLPDGRLSVSPAAWHALVVAREEVAALIALAVSGDPEGRG